MVTVLLEYNMDPTQTLPIMLELCLVLLATYMYAFIMLYSKKLTGAVSKGCLYTYSIS